MKSVNPLIIALLAVVGLGVFWLSFGLTVAHCHSYEDGTPVEANPAYVWHQHVTCNLTDSNHSGIGSSSWHKHANPPPAHTGNWMIDDGSNNGKFADEAAKQACLDIHKAWRGTHPAPARPNDLKTTGATPDCHGTTHDSHPDCGGQSGQQQFVAQQQIVQFVEAPQETDLATSQARAIGGGAALATDTISLLHHHRQGQDPDGHTRDVLGTDDGTATNPDSEHDAITVWDFSPNENVLHAHVYSFSFSAISNGASYRIPLDNRDPVSLGSVPKGSSLSGAPSFVYIEGGTIVSRVGARPPTEVGSWTMTVSKGSYSATFTINAYDPNANPDPIAQPGMGIEDVSVEDPKTEGENENTQNTYIVVPPLDDPNKPTTNKPTTQNPTGTTLQQQLSIIEGCTPLADAYNEYTVDISSGYTRLAIPHGAIGINGCGIDFENISDFVDVFPDHILYVYGVNLDRFSYGLNTPEILLGVGGYPHEDKKLYDGFGFLGNLSNDLRFTWSVEPKEVSVDLTIRAGYTAYGVPIRSEDLATLGDFFDLFSGVFSIRIRDDEGNSITVYRNTDTHHDIPIEGWRSYLIRSTSEETVTLTGETWRNPVAAAPHIQHYHKMALTWGQVKTGLVKDVKDLKGDDKTDE